MAEAAAAAWKDEEDPAVGQVLLKDEDCLETGLSRVVDKSKSMYGFR